MSFFTGTPGRVEQFSTLNKGQQPLHEQLLQANAREGAGGSYGTAADYYRDLLSNNSQTANDMFAPELRRFREQTIPDIAEQFAGMGGGGQGALSSGGFRNASVNAGTDLSERLGAIRAQLRQQGAEGLMNLGQQGLQNVTENVQFAPQGGFLDSIGPLLSSFASPVIGLAGGALSKGAEKLFSKKKGSTDPYGNANASGKPNPATQQYYDKG